MYDICVYILLNSTIYPYVSSDISLSYYRAASFTIVHESVMAIEHCMSMTLSQKIINQYVSRNHLKGMSLKKYIIILLIIVHSIEILKHFFIFS